MLACFVADPQVMPSLRWTGGRGTSTTGRSAIPPASICSISLLAWRKVDQWSRQKGEFVRRAGGTPCRRLLTIRVDYIGVSPVSSHFWVRFLVPPIPFTSTV